MAPVTLSWMHIPAWIWDFPVPTKELLPTFGSQVCYPVLCPSTAPCHCMDNQVTIIPKPQRAPQMLSRP